MSTSALGSAHERGLSGGEQIMCIIHSDAGLTGEQWPLPIPHFVTSSVLRSFGASRLSPALWPDSFCLFPFPFFPSGPRAYLPLSGLIASSFFLFLSFLRVVLLAGFRLVWFVVAWPFRSSDVLWGDKHLGIAGTFSPAPGCVPAHVVQRSLSGLGGPAARSNTPSPAGSWPIGVLHLATLLVCNSATLSA